MIHMLPRELARQKKAGGLEGGTQPPHLRGAELSREPHVLFVLDMIHMLPREFARL